ncbi:MAG: DUF459 domain-containing protein [bacterium]|nr:DUF459 domain-containing protein [bacterium]
MATGVVGCLLLTMFLVSGKLVEIAERQPLGDSRDRWLDVAEGVDRTANFLALNRPYDLITDIRGVGTDAGEKVDSIQAVAANLARERGSSSVSAPTAASEAPVATEAPAATSSPAQTESPTQDEQSSTSEAMEGPEPTAHAETPTPTGGPTPDGSPTPGVSPSPDGSPTATSSEIPDGEFEPTGASPDLPLGFDDDGLPLPPLPPADPSQIPPPKIRTVTADEPLRVYVAGDSQAFYPGHALAGAVDGGLLDVTVDSRNGTGLARPDFFNWPAEFLEIVAEQDPELVVLLMGGNDWQAMQSADGIVLIPGSEAWRSEWAWRMHITFDTLVAPHRHVVWVGLAPARTEPFSIGNPIINEISWPVTLVRPNVTMVDIWELFGGDGPYQDSIAPPWGGDPVRVRPEDGIHLNRTGSAWVAELVVEVARERWEFEESG